MATVKDSLGELLVLVTATHQVYCVIRRRSAMYVLKHTKTLVLNIDGKLQDIQKIKETGEHKGK